MLHFLLIDPDDDGDVLPSLDGELPPGLRGDGLLAGLQVDTR